MKITIDTNFLVSYKLLIRLIEKEAEIYTTKEILHEFAEVLERDFKHNKEEINEIIGKLLSFVTIIEPNSKLNIIKEDSDDNIILECAVASNSQYILTYDKHLLKLKEYKNIKIIKPEELNL